MKINQDMSLYHLNQAKAKAKLGNASNAKNEDIEAYNKKLKGVRIKFKTEESNFICSNCGNEWKFDDMKKKFSEDEGEAIHFIPEVAFVHGRCPKCGSPDFEISKGRGVSILSIKGEK